MQVFCSRRIKMCIRDRYEEIPQNFVNCMVSIEDKKFYKHNGVDLSLIHI